MKKNKSERQNDQIELVIHRAFEDSIPFRDESSNVLKQSTLKKLIIAIGCSAMVFIGVFKLFENAELLNHSNAEHRKLNSEILAYCCGNALGDACCCCRPSPGRVCPGGCSLPCSGDSTGTSKDDIKIELLLRRMDNLMYDGKFTYNGDATLNKLVADLQKGGRWDTALNELTEDGVGNETLNDLNRYMQSERVTTEKKKIFLRAYDDEGDGNKPLDVTIEKVQPLDVFGCGILFDKMIFNESER